MGIEGEGEGRPSTDWRAVEKESGACCHALWSGGMCLVYVDLPSTSLPHEVYTI